MLGRLGTFLWWTRAARSAADQEAGDEDRERVRLEERKLELEERKLWMQAVSLEYTTRCAEIAQRSDHQNRLLQIHLTAVTFLAGILVSQDAYWLVFLLPIESAIFGLWWLDHAFTVFRLGLFVAVPVERNIRRRVALADWVVTWESQWNAHDMADLIEDEELSRRVRRYNMAVDLTFIGPAGAGLLAGVVLVVRSLEWFPERWDPLDPELVPYSSWSGIAVGILLLEAAVYLMFRYWRLRDLWRRLVDVRPDLIDRLLGEDALPQETSSEGGSLPQDGRLRHGRPEVVRRR